MITLLPAQKRAVIGLQGILAKQRGAVLRGETGVGKTFIAAEVAREYTNVLIICKASAIKDVGSKFDDYRPRTFDIMSYQAFGDVIKTPIEKLKGYDLIIFDECHFLANWSAAYTKRFVKDLRMKDIKYLFMSGTPMIKSAKDFLYVLRKCGCFANMTMEELKIHFFNATPSPYGKGMILGEFRNENEFQDAVDDYVYEITKAEVSRNHPQPKITTHILEGESADFKDITECTKARKETGLRKVEGATYAIRKYWRDNRITTSIILCHFHEVAEEMGKALGVQVATTKEKVYKEFKRLNNKGGHLVTTTGLTSSSLDCNKCNWVFMVESSYSAALDKQSYDRCDRIGKKLHLNVVYFAFDGEHTHIRSMEREYLKGRFDHDPKTRIYPSYLDILDTCAGSHWLPDSRDIPSYIENAAINGSKKHAVLERYIKAGRKASTYASPEVRYAVEFCNSLRKGCKLWGVESRSAYNYRGFKVSGKLDFWCYDNDEKTLYIYDYKNGKTPVRAENNLQLIAYAVMALETFNVKPKEVVVGIIQSCQTKEVTFNLEDMEANKQRINGIIDRVIKAKDKPLEHLNKEKCSTFCKASAIHKRG